MSVVAVALLLGALVVMLLRTRTLRLGSALVCVIFGFVLGATPAGPSVGKILNDAGEAAWSALQSL